MDIEPKSYRRGAQYPYAVIEDPQSYAFTLNQSSSPAELLNELSEDIAEQVSLLNYGYE